MEEIKGFDVVLKELSQVKKVENIILQWLIAYFLCFSFNTSVSLFVLFFSSFFCKYLIVSLAFDQ